MTTLISCLERQLERRRAAGESSKNVAGFRRTIRHFIAWLETNAAVASPDQLRTEHLERWLTYLRSRRIKHSGLLLRPASFDGEVSRVQYFCKRLAADGYAVRRLPDVLAGLRSRYLLPKPTPSHTQVRQWLRDMPVDTHRQYMFRSMAEVLYTSAMRPCELLALDVGDIDLEHGLARVLGKGRKDRMVPLGRTARRLLENYLFAVRPLRLKQPDQALWLNDLGTRLTYPSVQAHLHRCLSDGSGMRVTCYSLRRACATEMIRSGASLWMVKELLGHEQLETMKHYVQLTIVDLQKTHARCHPRDAVQLSEFTERSSPSVRRARGRAAVRRSAEIVEADSSNDRPTIPQSTRGSER